MLTLEPHDISIPTQAYFSTRTHSEKTLSTHIINQAAGLGAHLRPPLAGDTFQAKPKKYYFCSYLQTFVRCPNTQRQGHMGTRVNA